VVPPRQVVPPRLSRPGGPSRQASGTQRPLPAPAPAHDNGLRPLGVRTRGSYSLARMPPHLRPALLLLGMLLTHAGCGGSEPAQRPSPDPSGQDEEPAEARSDTELSPRGDPGYQKGLSRICHAERLSGASPGAPSEERMERAADWLVAHLEDPWAIGFLTRLAERSQEERVELLAREAQAEGLSSCPLIELIRAQPARSDARPAPDAGSGPSRDGGRGRDGGTGRDASPDGSG
jgi:hypothetical protein